MKIVTLLIACTFFCLALNAQTFEVDTVLKNGPVTDRINLVFLGDGYTAGEQGKFITDVDEILTEMFSQTPFKQYKSYFNAFAIKVISLESGANHPKTTADPDCTMPVAVVNNYFGSTFDYQGIHRLLYPTNLAKVINVLSTHFPLYDQAFIAVNSPYYGGAGGFVATCSSHASGLDVAMHEIGHSFAGLADEYWAGSGYAVEKPNMTRQTSPALVKWKNWIGTAGVGIYPHSGDASWKKPHTNCKMGVLHAPLCNVCSETFVERFHLFVKPLSGFSPVENNFHIDPELEQNLNFSLSLIPPDPNTLRITWEKDNVVISKNVESVTIASADIDIEASAIIRAIVHDTISLTRAESHTANHIYIVEWEVTRSLVTGTEVQTSSRQFNVSVYPNPSDGDLRFSYILSKPGSVTVSLMDNNGRKIKTLVNALQENGAYNYAFRIEELNISSAAYIVQFNFGKTIVPVKVILK
jgi:hypothetical protein